jgi:hypothetical protein
MSYRPQTRSSRNFRHGYQKSLHEKTKAKRAKHQSRNKLLQEENKTATLEEIVEKTITSLRQLGSQVFAVSPFSNYFNDWLVNLKEVVSEFESSRAVSVDEQFTQEGLEIFSRVKLKLEERRREEANLEKESRRRSEANHLLLQIDEEYAAKTREIGPKRNTEIQRLTRNVHNLEEELGRVGRMKTSIFGPFSKKAKAQKEADIGQKLSLAKNELSATVEKFKVEQEKLHDDYEKKKQIIIVEVRNLEEKIESLEKDNSLEARRETGEALVKAVNGLLQRKKTAGYE